MSNYSGGIYLQWKQIEFPMSVVDLLLTELASYCQEG